MNNLSQKIFINSKFIKSKSKKFLIVENPSTLQPMGKISIENKTEVNKVAKSVKQEQKKSVHGKSSKKTSVLVLQLICAVQYSTSLDKTLPGR